MPDQPKLTPETLRVAFEVDSLLQELLDLTPGGSEFCGSVRNCLDFIRERMLSAGKVAAERNRLRDELAAANRRIEALENAYNMAMTHLDEECIASPGMQRVIADLAAQEDEKQREGV